MRCVWIFGLLAWAVGMGCENTAFYHEKTKEWFGPLPASTAPPPVLGSNPPPVAAKPS